MAQPRVFISSTYYDLTAIRSELWRFIRNLGFEPVANENGQVAYGRHENLEDYCYKEIAGCDILVSIIGGRFGTPSKSDAEHSVAQTELRVAHKLKKQIHIFVLGSVFSEFETFKLNRDLNLKFAAVNDVRVYRFLDEIQLLHGNNATFPFNTGLEIIELLKEQWAGLFKMLLTQENERRQLELLHEIRAVAYEIRGIAAELKNSNKHQAKKENAKIPESPLPAALRECFLLPYLPEIPDLQSLIDFLEHHGYLAGIPAAGVEDTHLFFRGNDFNLFISRYLIQQDGTLRQLHASEWAKDYFVKSGKGNDALPAIFKGTRDGIGA